MNTVRDTKITAFVNVSEYGRQTIKTDIVLGNDSTNLSSENGEIRLALSLTDAQKLRDELTALIATQ